MKVRKYYQLAWKNSKQRENYESQGNLTTSATFEIWGISQSTGKSINIPKNTEIHIVSVDTKEASPNVYFINIDYNKDVIRTQLDEQQLLSLGFKKMK